MRIDIDHLFLFYVYHTPTEDGLTFPLLSGA
jgi:hypothetical protein